MAKKMQPPPVQFRPGPLLGRLLSDVSRRMSVGVGETVRRLAAMAICGLDLEVYGALADLTAALAEGGRWDFVAACDHVYTALQSHNRARTDREPSLWKRARSGTSFIA